LADSSGFSGWAPISLAAAELAASKQVTEAGDSFTLL
jgi:hypothetical protein